MSIENGEILLHSEVGLLSSEIYEMEGWMDGWMDG
jgi:hypothetical protein